MSGNDNTSSDGEARQSVGFDKLAYLNNNFRLNASYSHTAFSGGGTVKATVTVPAGRCVFTRVQLTF